MPRKNRPTIRGTTPELEARARELRRDMPAAQKILWRALRRRQLHGLKFRAEHPMGDYIVDLYCPERRLVIEVDGGVHSERVARDKARTRVIESYGYRVIRFTNEEVFSSLEAVLEQIATAVLPAQDSPQMPKTEPR